MDTVQQQQATHLDVLRAIINAADHDGIPTPIDIGLYDSSVVLRGPDDDADTCATWAVLFGAPAPEVDPEPRGWGNYRWWRYTTGGNAQWRGLYVRVWCKLDQPEVAP
jgi:hypothetical protein